MNAGKHSPVIQDHQQIQGTEGKVEVQPAGGVGRRHLTDTIVCLVPEEAGAPAQTIRQKSQIQISVRIPIRQIRTIFRSQRRYTLVAEFDLA